MTELQFVSKLPPTARKPSRSGRYNKNQEVYDTLVKHPNQWAQIYADVTRSASVKISKMRGIEIAYETEGLGKTENNVQKVNVWASYSPDKASKEMNKVTDASLLDPGGNLKDKTKSKNVQPAVKDDDEYDEYEDDDDEVEDKALYQRGNDDDELEYDSGSLPEEPF